MKQVLKAIINSIVKLTLSLGCLLGLHAYVNGYCKYCGKKQ